MKELLDEMDKCSDEGIFVELHMAPSAESEGPSDIQMCLRAQDEPGVRYSTPTMVFARDVLSEGDKSESEVLAGAMRELRENLEALREKERGQ